MQVSGHVTWSSWINSPASTESIKIDQPAMKTREMSHVIEDNKQLHSIAFRRNSNVHIKLNHGVVMETDKSQANNNWMIIENLFLKLKLLK